MAKRKKHARTGAQAKIVNYLSRPYGKDWVRPSAAILAKQFRCSEATVQRAFWAFKKARFMDETSPRGYAKPLTITQKVVPQATASAAKYIGVAEPSPSAGQPFWVADVEKHAYANRPVTKPLTDLTDYPAMVKDIEDLATVIDAAANNPEAVRAGCRLLKDRVCQRQF